MSFTYTLAWAPMSQPCVPQPTFSPGFASHMAPALAQYLMASPATTFGAISPPGYSCSYMGNPLAWPGIAATTPGLEAMRPTILGQPRPARNCTAGVLLLQDAWNVPQQMSMVRPVPAPVAGKVLSGTSKTDAAEQGSGETGVQSMRKSVVRQERIRRYKEKQRRWREAHPLCKKYEGRRHTALGRLRVNGRFATRGEQARLRPAPK